MLGTNQFPRSILAALDALAELGKSIQTQAIVNQATLSKKSVENIRRGADIQKLNSSRKDEKSLMKFESD
jgi:hypothetical protein